MCVGGAIASPGWLPASSPGSPLAQGASIIPGHSRRGLGCALSILPRVGGRHPPFWLSHSFALVARFCVGSKIGDPSHVRAGLGVLGQNLLFWMLSCSSGHEALFLVPGAQPGLAATCRRHHSVDRWPDVCLCLFMAFISHSSGCAVPFPFPRITEETRHDTGAPICSQFTTGKISRH